MKASSNRSFDTDAQMGPLPSVALGFRAGQVRRWMTAFLEHR
jgi:hypothetical protein